MLTSRTRPVRLAAGAAAFLVALGLATTARAQTQVRAQVTTSTGVSSTQPEGDLAGFDDGVGSFYNVEPGVEVRSELSRSTHVLSAGGGFSGVVGGAGTSGGFARLDYMAAIDTTAYSVLVLRSTGAYGKSGVLFGRSRAAAAPLSPQPAEELTFTSAGAEERFDLELSTRWRLVQDLSASMFYPMDRTVIPENSGIAGGLGLIRVLARDELGATGRVEWRTYDRVELPAERIARLRLSWLRDHTSTLATTVEGGPLHYAPEGGVSRSHWFARATAVLSNSIGALEATAGHDLSSNALQGQVLLVDELGVRGSMPLTDDRMSFTTASGLQRVQGIDPATGTTVGEANVLILDLGLDYRMSDNVDVTGRYQLTWQDSGLGLEGTAPGFLRHVVMFSVEGSWPRAPRERRGGDPIRARRERSDGGAR